MKRQGKTDTRENMQHEEIHTAEPTFTSVNSKLCIYYHVYFQTSERHATWMRSLSTFKKEKKKRSCLSIWG